MAGSVTVSVTVDMIAKAVHESATGVDDIILRMLHLIPIIVIQIQPILRMPTRVIPIPMGTFLTRRREHTAALWCCCCVARGLVVLIVCGC